jgi:hypothetical protein
VKVGCSIRALLHYWVLSSELLPIPAHSDRERENRFVAIKKKYELARSSPLPHQSTCFIGKFVVNLLF